MSFVEAYWPVLAAVGVVLGLIGYIEWYERTVDRERREESWDAWSRKGRKP